MSKQLRVWLAGTTVVALGLGFALVGLAQEDVNLKVEVEKMSKAVAKGGEAAAKKQAQALAKKLPDVYDLMHLYRPRTKKGLGVGAKPGVAVPDGIELKLIALGRDAPSPNTLKKEAKAIEEMAYDTAAISLVTSAKPPERDEGKRKRKDWIQWSDDVREGALQLAKAAQMKSGNEIRMAATKINNACNSCHTTFRD